jgi:hypothetical protein
MAKKIFFIFIDYLIIPGIIILITYEPNFLTGYIDHLETGQYLTCINGIFQGKVPYKDFFTLFGPLSVYLPAFLMLFLGKTISTLRIFFYFTTILSLIILYLVSRIVIKRRFFTYLVAFLAVTEIYHPFWASQWVWFKMGLGLLCIGLALLYRKKGHRFYIFLSGLTCAISLLYSAEVGVFAIIAICATILLVPRDTNRLKYATMSYLLLGIGFCSIMLPFFIYMASKSALIDYLYTTFYVFPFLHAKMWGHPNSLSLISLLYDNSNYSSLYNIIVSDLFKVHMPMFLYAGCFAYILISLVRRNREYNFFSITLLSFYGGLLYISSFRAIEGPQFQISIAPFIILCGVFLEKTFELYLQTNKRQSSRNTLEKKATKRTVTLLFILSIFIFSTFYVVASRKRYYASLEKWIHYQILKKYLVPHYLGPLVKNRMDLVPLELERAGKIYIPRGQAAEIYAVTDFIVKNTKNEEIVFCFPEHGIYNFLANRPPLSRFYIAGFAQTTPRWRNELFDELQTKRPRIIIRGNRLSNLAMSIDSKAEILPEITEYINKHYTLLKRIYGINIFKLKEKSEQ